MVNLKVQVNNNNGLVHTNTNTPLTPSKLSVNCIHDTIVLTESVLTLEMAQTSPLVCCHDEQPDPLRNAWRMGYRDCDSQQTMT